MKERMKERKKETNKERTKERNKESKNKRKKVIFVVVLHTEKSSNLSRKLSRFKNCYLVNNEGNTPKLV